VNQNDGYAARKAKTEPCQHEASVETVREPADRDLEGQAAKHRYDMNNAIVARVVPISCIHAGTTA
jgi:hypothetical protein